MKKFESFSEVINKCLYYYDAQTKKTYKCELTRITCGDDVWNFYKKAKGNGYWFDFWDGLCVQNIQQELIVTYVDRGKEYITNIKMIEGSSYDFDRIVKNRKKEFYDSLTIKGLYKQLLEMHDELLEKH